MTSLNHINPQNVSRETNQKALIAMSGGVDSSVAVHLMLERGFDCIGVTMKLFDTNDRKINNIEESPDTGGSEAQTKQLYSQTGKTCCSLSDINDAREIAHLCGIPHYVLNLKNEFKKNVIERFINIYEAGATPNPCIDCNRFIKFNLLLLRARQLEFDFLVTGHYAQVEKSGTRFILKKARDEKKDQSYVLYAMNQEQLAHTIFPLGDLTKEEVRTIAVKKGFINAAKHDSQDICFVPDGNYGNFIEKYLEKKYESGEIIDINRKTLGRHKGFLRYTIGQRRGLGVSSQEVLYVTEKSAEKNTITLGPERYLYSKSLIADDANFIAVDRIDGPMRVTAKTRYLQKEQSAVVEQTGQESFRLDFDTPQRAITPGQACVLYDGDIVIGGGTIR